MRRSWPEVPLGELLQQVDRSEAVNPEGTYRLLGVRLEGNGAFLRETVSGTETAAARLNRVAAGDFIFSRLFAWRGAFGLIGTELDGCFVSNEFPVFTASPERVNTAYLRYWFRLPAVWRRVEEDCTGSTPTTRNRYKEQFFLSLKIPLPPTDEQQATVRLLDTLADKIAAVDAELDAIEGQAEQLLVERFAEAVVGAGPRLMAEIAPAVRRQVEVDSAVRYREVGARSFGKGLFFKPAFDGGEVTWQKPVWIRAGDIVLSNIKAWEGAIARAYAEHDGCIASHRYITCVPDPGVVTAGFLNYFLRSPGGLEKIGSASPGTADRNRTLSLAGLGKIEVPLPALPVQQGFDELEERVGELKGRHAAIRAANDALLGAVVERVLGGGG